MNEHSNIEKKLRTKDITICIGSFCDYGIENPYPKDGKPYVIDFGLRNVKNIDLESSADQIKENKFLSAGKGTYVISEIDDSDKSSKKFNRCTGLVVAGISKKTGKNVSFVSHQDPFEFLLTKKKEFVVHLQQRLNEMKEMCEEGTIDAKIIGGIFFTDAELDSYQVMQTYPPSIELIGKELKDILGFEPTIVNGPKTTRKLGDDIYYDNENRRLYFLRPKVNPKTRDFIPSDIDSQKSQWE